MFSFLETGCKFVNFGFRFSLFLFLYILTLLYFFPGNLFIQKKIKCMERLKKKIEKKNQKPKFSNSLI